MNKMRTRTNESGVAILTVMSSIIFLTLILSTLTYETQLGRIKTYNAQDKFQARLTAESGINFVLAKLKIYHKARNLIEKRKNSPVTVGDLQSVLTLPFVYPPILPNDANLIQKNALEEFIEDTILKGNLSVTVSAVSGFLNPNNLRIKKGEDEDEDEEHPVTAYTEQQFIDTLTNIIEDFKKNDEEGDYQVLLGDIEPYMMIKELKFFVNSLENFRDDERAELLTLYSENNATAKHAPLTSLSELYLLQGWNDFIIDAMIKRMSVHQVSIIPINELTKGQLKTFFPNISEEQLKDFFTFRDGDIENDVLAQPFFSVAAFKDLMTGQLGVVSEGEFDTLVSDLNSADMRFGVAGALYQVISRGEYGRAVYTIKAYVNLPVKPSFSKSTKKETKDDDKLIEEKKKEEEKTPLQFFEPRIVEIEIL